jgi:hypothetical protein
VKKVKTMLCTFFFSRFRTLWETYSSERKGDKRKHQEKSRLGKNTKSGGSDPTFSASRRPKSFLWSLPPCGTSNGAWSFFQGAEVNFGTTEQGETACH